MDILAPNLLILASAGSGKTYRLADRVIGLVAKGIAPEKIVALTFTRKAAGEFTDSVLNKLANAADNKSFATELRMELKLPEADFSDSLEKVVRALPRFTLSTMDGFFAKVVRGFQYELGLTGGKFDLLEGPRAKAATESILFSVLGETLNDQAGEDFLHAFRRAIIGKEEQGVMRCLSDFIDSWQKRYRSSQHLQWGPDFLPGIKIEDWERQKQGLYEKVFSGLDDIKYTHKSQREALEKFLLEFRDHTISSGSISNSNFWNTLVQTCADNDFPLKLKHHKEFIFGGPAGEALRDMVNLAAGCEMVAALLRTRALHDVIAKYDSCCEKQLRQRGLLGFDDVKVLMGEWAKSEDARLRREAVDFRLDSRYEHWLLDEFQDTSRSEWIGLLPLIDEAATDHGSLFIVGDRKQAIYAWRGGEASLFQEVIDRYGDELKIEKMAESWRSCPEVLELVNQVCGDTTTLREIFGKSADLWEWQKHFSASKLATPAGRGEARVEVVEGARDARLARLVEILEELGIGKREMTCGVLVRTNDLVVEVADYLRAAGFDVIEEGRRQPSKDSPVGIVLEHLLRWLANPADSYAWEVIEMSPFAQSLRTRFGESWHQIWEGLLDRVSQVGFAGMAEEVVDACWSGWSDFGRRRAGDIIMALAGLDNQGGTTPQRAADWIKRLEVAQSPGIAAVQVMTIHKAKGLGFDVVVIPEVPKVVVPSSQNFDAAEKNGEWITQTPPRWARDLIPEMRQAETEWAMGQQYEAFCMLYVALTRSKRGLYVLLEPPSKTQAAEKTSLSNWLATSICSNGLPGVVAQFGSPDWVEAIAPTIIKKQDLMPAVLPVGVARRSRVSPSGMKQKQDSNISNSATGMVFGSDVHAAFEMVGWIDEVNPILPNNDAGSLVASLVAESKFCLFFQRGGRAVELFREQAIDAALDGEWISGIIDRLHLHRDESGRVTRVEVIDFKTDAVNDICSLSERYSGQMNTYRKVIEKAYPNAKVECILLSTRCREWMVV